jgi:hypothetical protein
MGEWSKTVGEKGEKIVDFFFKDVLGYKNIMQNETIECIKGKKHKNGSIGERKTHGIDALINIKSPVEDVTLDIAYISTKFTATKYPNAPKSKFKEYVTDLVYGMECFKNSELSTTVNQTHSNVKKTDLTGIIIWASNESAQDESIVSKVSNVQLDSDLIFDKLFLIDNNRLNFYVETIQLAKKEFGKENVKFIYHNSGLNNVTLQSTSYGDFLPIQYLISDIIPLRIYKNDKIELVICCKDEFSEDSLTKILDFSKSFDHLDSISATILSFPDYNDLNHQSTIISVLSKFGHYNFQTNFYVKKHTEDFRNY